MMSYRLKILLQYAGAILVAMLALVLIYSLFLSPVTETLVGELQAPLLEFGISVVTIVAPLVAIMDGLLTWLRMMRDHRVKRELIQVIEAQSTSPGGMDMDALERESGLPREILIERVNELILLGRIGVRLSTGNNREYFLNVP